MYVCVCMCVCVFVGAFSGVLHVNVHKIDEFSDTAGVMDRTDPYVLLQLGAVALIYLCMRP